MGECELCGKIIKSCKMTKIQVSNGPIRYFCRRCYRKNTKKPLQDFRTKYKLWGDRR